MRRMVFLFAALAFSLSLVLGCEKDKVTGPGSSGSDLPIPDQIALSRDIPALLANGVSTTQIYATVVDAQRRVLAGAAVYFVADRGLVEPFGTTDNSGVASTTYTSAASAVDVTARITAQAFKDTLGSPLPGALVLLSKEPLSQDLLDKTVEARRSAVGDGVAMAAADVVEDHVDVKLLGITLTVTATPSAIPADGISTSKVHARLVETTSNVPLDGESVRFGATAGAITGRVTTDATGTATATLTSTATGTAGITVYYGNLLTTTTSVSFSALNLTALRRSGEHRRRRQDHDHDHRAAGQRAPQPHCRGPGSIHDESRFDHRLRRSRMQAGRRRPRCARRAAPERQRFRRPTRARLP